jgi:AcrR family transcriptional regulator
MYEDVGSRMLALASWRRTQKEHRVTVSDSSPPARRRDADSRQRILSAAFELMAETGYSGTSISMICERSGLPPSSTYWHFGSKEGLLSAVVEDTARHWLEGLPRWSTIEGESEHRLRTLLAAVAERTASDPTPMRLLFLLALERGSALDQTSLRVMRDLRRSAAKGFHLAFRELFDVDTADARRLSDQLAAFALAVADGATMARLLDSDPDIPTIFEHLGTAFLAIGDAHLARRTEPSAGTRERQGQVRARRMPAIQRSGSVARRR